MEGISNTHPPCGLLPACKEGYHGCHVTSKGEYEVKPIGKYYFTEVALKHDLSALQKGDIYNKADFYKRAKAWYKAEIDRLLHLERVKQENSPQTAASRPNEQPLMPNTGREPPRRNPPQPRPSLPPETPTRIQPPRAAKRKATEAAYQRPPPRKKQTLKPTAREQAETQTSPTVTVQQTPNPDNQDPEQEETRGDYTLAANDWAQFRNGNKGEHHPSPWSYVQLQGLDVAYFCMRLERAVEGIVREVLGREGWKGVSGAGIDVDREGAHHDQGEQVCVESVSSSDKDEEESKGEVDKGSDGGRKGGERQLRVQVHPIVRCAIGDRYAKPEPFEPAAALTPGEDWRPPNLKTGSANATGVKGHTNRTKNGARGGPVSTWAADEVGRRQEMNRRTGLAPEADMEISPTLGRWAKDGMGVPVEDLGANIVEVSGLRFAVDLCACKSRRGLGAELDGVRIVMV